MGRNEHDRLAADLSAFLDGELSRRRADEIERALERPGPLQREYEELRAVRDRLRALPRVAAPDGFAEFLRDSLEREGLRTTAIDPDLQRPGAARRRALQMSLLRIGASAAVLVVGVLIGRELGRRMPYAQEPLNPRGSGGPVAVTPRGTVDLAAGDPNPDDVEHAREIALSQGNPPESNGVHDTAASRGGRAEARTPARDFGSMTSEQRNTTRSNQRPADESDAAIVDVVVTSTDAAQFAEMQAILNFWEAEQAAGRGVEGIFDDLPGVETAAAPPDAASAAPPPIEAERPVASAKQNGAPPALPKPDVFATEVVLQLPVWSVTELIEGLERRAPEQVRVQMNLRGSEASLLRQLAADPKTPRPAGAPPEAQRTNRGRRALVNRRAQVEPMNTGTSSDLAAGPGQADASTAASQPGELDQARRRALEVGIADAGRIFGDAFVRVLLQNLEEGDDAPVTFRVKVVPPPESQRGGAP